MEADLEEVETSAAAIDTSPCEGLHCLPAPLALPPADADVPDLLRLAGVHHSVSWAAEIADPDLPAFCCLAGRHQSVSQAAEAAGAVGAADGLAGAPKWAAEGLHDPGAAPVQGLAGTAFGQDQSGQGQGALQGLQPESGLLYSSPGM